MLLSFQLVTRVLPYHRFLLSHIFATVKSNSFLCLFFLVYIPITVYHSHLFVNFTPKPVDRHSRLIYEANLFDDNFNDLNKFLTILKCPVDLDFEFNVAVDSCMNSNLICKTHKIKLCQGFNS